MIKRALPKAVAPATAAPPPSKVEQLEEQRMAQATTTWPTMYDDVSYNNIIEAWLQNKGIYGGVAQGNRNNMYYQLALELRYICDFKKDWLLQVMPTWDMPLAEREQTIQSALNRPQGRQIPDALLAAIQKVKSVDNVGELDEQAVSNEMRNPLPKSLPYIFRLIARRFPANPHAMITCALPPLGALCTNVHGEYIDGEEESPQFYCILTAPQASGKRVARRIDNLIAYPIKEHDDEQRKAIMEYKKELKKAKNAKTQPDEPETNIRKVPAKISQRVFLERTYNAEGRSLYSFGEELDTLTKSMKGGAWADLSDILRLAFDGGEFGSDFASENSFAATCQARWCLLLCGTWGAVERFFPNVEDGTMTRFMFAQLEDSLGKPLLPKSKMGMNRDESAIKEEAQRLYEAGSLADVTRVKLPKTIAALLQWQALQIKIFNLGGKTDTALDTLRRRSMLMGFRAGLVACATERFKETNAVADFAVWVAQEVLDQQMALFAKELNAVNRHESSIKAEARGRLRRNSTMRILAELPDEFTELDVVDAYEAMGMQKNVALQTIKRWLGNQVITEIKDKKTIKFKKNANG